MDPCRADEISTATTPEFGVYSKTLAALLSLGV
jgi:hypothetical protein